jgi:hypothetical protein
MGLCRRARLTPCRCGVVHPLTEKTWCICKSDLADWLDRQAPQQSLQVPSKTEPVHRYSGDGALIEEGRRLIADGMSKRSAAKQLAPRAEGGALDQREERLRKLL